jgi:Gas vesicle synthesis protein GvpL/GvpF
VPEYVYAVVEPKHRPSESPGITGAKLRLIKGGGVAALVSRLRSREPELGRDELLVHASVLEAALAAGTVLPMRFGTVMEDDDAVRTRLLEPNAAALSQELTRLKDKVELRIRAVYDQECLLREIVQGDGEIARLRQALRHAPRDATYYDQIRLGELVAHAIERKRKIDADHLVDKLSPVAEAVDVADAPHERVALNASFLVHRKRVPEFDAELERVAEEQANRLRVKYTGPLPPHSFVEMEAVS